MYLIRHRLLGLTKIFTDGSKDPLKNTCGCAFLIPELKLDKCFKLPPYCSIFICELTAIYKCLSWLQDLRPCKVAIFCGLFVRPPITKRFHF